MIYGCESCGVLNDVLNVILMQSHIVIKLQDEGKLLALCKLIYKFII